MSKENKLKMLRQLLTITIILLLATIQLIDSTGIDQSNGSDNNHNRINRPILRNVKTISPPLPSPIQQYLTTTTSSSSSSSSGGGSDTNIDTEDEFRDTNRFIDMYNDFPKISYDTIHQILRDEDNSDGSHSHSNNHHEQNINDDDLTLHRNDDQRYRRRWKELNTFEIIPPPPPLPLLPLLSSSSPTTNYEEFHDENNMKNSLLLQREKRHLTSNSINTPRLKNSTKILNLINHNLKEFNFQMIQNLTPPQLQPIEINLIEILNLTNNQLINFNFEQIPEKFINLRILDLSANNINEFQFNAQSMNSIQILNLTNNQISKFTTVNINNEENFIDNIQLKELTLSNNCMKTIDMINLTMINNLESLDLSSNQIRKLDADFLKHVKNLKKLNLSKNLLGGQRKTPTNNKDTDDGNSVINENNIKIHQNATKSQYKLNNQENANTVMDGDEIIVFKEPFNNLLNIETLILSYNNIRYIDIETFLVLPNLQYLDLSYNMIQGESIKSLQGIPDLVGLSIAYNSDLGDSLQEFVATWSLKELDASGTGLCRIPAALAQSVRTLKLVDNWLSIINCGDLDSYPLLQYLDLSNSHIDEIEDDALGRLEMLETLFLDHNNLKHIPISLPTSLETLFLQNNRITDIQSQIFQNLHNLQTLDLSCNKLLYLPGLPLPKLLILNLQSSELKRLSQSVVKTSPKLRDLLLDDNPIKCSDLLGIAEWTSSCHEENYQINNNVSNGNNGYRGIDIEQNGQFILPKNLKQYFQQRNNYFRNFQMSTATTTTSCNNCYDYGQNYNEFGKIAPKCANNFKIKQQLNKKSVELQQQQQQHSKYENGESLLVDASTFVNSDNNRNNDGQKDAIKTKFTTQNHNIQTADEYSGHQDKKYIIENILQTTQETDIIKPIAEVASSPVSILNTKPLSDNKNTTNTNNRPTTFQSDQLSAPTSSLLNIQQTRNFVDKENQNLIRAAAPPPLPLQVLKKLSDNNQGKGKTFENISFLAIMDKNHADVASNLLPVSQTIKTTATTIADAVSVSVDVALIKLLKSNRNTTQTATTIQSTLPTTNPVQLFNLDSKNTKKININTEIEQLDAKIHPILSLFLHNSTTNNQNYNNNNNNINFLAEISTISTIMNSSGSKSMRNRKEVNGINDTNNIEILNNSFAQIHLLPPQKYYQQQQSDNIKRNPKKYETTITEQTEGKQQQQQQQKQLIKNSSVILSRMKSDNHYVETSVLLSQHGDDDINTNKNNQLHMKTEQPNAVQQHISSSNLNGYSELQEKSKNPIDIEIFDKNATEQPVSSTTPSSNHNLQKINDPNKPIDQIWQHQDRRQYGSRLLKDNIFKSIHASATSNPKEEVALIDAKALENQTQEIVKRDENIDETKSQTKLMLTTTPIATIATLAAAPPLNEKHQQELNPNFSKIKTTRNNKQIDEINRSEIKRISSASSSVNNKNFNHQIAAAQLLPIKNNVSQQFQTSTESATLLARNSKNWTLTSELKAGETSTYLPTLNSYLLNPGTSAISNIQSEIEPQRRHLKTNKIRSLNNAPKTSDSSSHTRRSIDRSIIIPISNNEQNIIIKRNPESENSNQQHSIPPILLQGNSFQANLHQPSGQQQNLTESHHQSQNNHQDRKINEIIQSTATTTLPTSIYDDNIHSSISKIEPIVENSKIISNLSNNQNSAPATTANTEWIIKMRTLKSNNINNDNEKAQQNLIEDAEQNNHNGQQQRQDDNSKIIINKNIIKQHNYSTQKQNITKGSNKIIDLSASSGVTKPQYSDEKSISLPQFDKNREEHTADNIKLSEIENLMSNSKDQHTNDDNIQSLLIQSQIYHHYANIEPNTNSKKSLIDDGNNNSINEFQLDTTKFIKLEHQKHVENLEQHLPAATESKVALKTEGNVKTRTEFQNGNNFDLTGRPEILNKNENYAKNKVATGDQSIPILLDESSQLENPNKMKNQVENENQLKLDNNNLQNSVTVTKAPHKNYKKLNMKNVSQQESNHHHINKININRNNNVINENTENDNGLPPEQWLEIRPNNGQTTTGHPGLFIVIGITFGLILILGIVHIYRCHCKPSWYYGYQHNHHQHDDQQQHNPNHPEIYNLQHTNCNGRRRFRSAQSQAHQHPYKSNNQLNINCDDIDEHHCCIATTSTSILANHQKFDNNSGRFHETATNNCPNCLENDRVNHDYYIEMDSNLRKSQATLMTNVNEPPRDILPMELLRSSITNSQNTNQNQNVYVSSASAAGAGASAVGAYDDEDDEDFENIDINCPSTSNCSVNYSRYGRKTPNLNISAKRYW